MRRLLTWTLIILFLFSGCAAAPNDFDSFAMDKVVAGRSPMPASAESAEDGVVYSQWTENTAGMDDADLASFAPYENLVSVFVKLEQKQTLAEDGTVLFTRQSQSPIVSNTLSEGVYDMLNRQVAAYLQKINAEADQWEEEAAVFYSDIQQTDPDYEFYGWSSYTSVSPQRVDENYISLVFFNSQYLGGAHPNNVQTALNFDSVTGALLPLASVFKTEYKQTVLNMLLEHLWEMETSFGLFDGYEDTVREKFEKMPADMAQNWYLTDQGIVFFFSPYEISPYAAGVVTVELSYDELDGMLRDDFVLPYDTYDAGGSIRIERNSNAKNFANVEYAMTSDGVEFDLITSGTVYDLRLSQIQWAEGVPVSEQIIYAANRFTDGDLLHFSVDDSQSSPGISVSYVTGGEDAATLEYFILEGKQLIAQDG